MTIYTDLKYVNEAGGIQATRTATGVGVYLEPGGDLHQMAIDGQWGAIAPYIAPPVEVKPQQVKDEARRRILLICPVWRQSNMLAQAATLNDKGRDNWTAQELEEWEAGEAIWQQIQAIRTASDVIEALDPIPEDYTADTHWTT